MEFHPERPSLLLTGLYNGEVRLWEISNTEEPQLACSPIDDYCHKEPVTRSAQRGVAGHLSFLLFCFWRARVVIFCECFCLGGILGWIWMLVRGCGRGFEVSFRFMPSSILMCFVLFSRSSRV